MCKSKKENVEVDPSIALKFGIKVTDIRDIMELKSPEATAKIKEDFGGVEGLARKLNTDIVNGLSGEPQDISDREITFGKNVIPPKPPKLFIQLVFEALQDTTLIVLMVCAVVSIGLSFYHPADTSLTEEMFNANEQNLEWIEGIAILVAVIVVVLVTSFNDWSKERQFRGLQDRIEKENFASVIRNGQIKQIGIKELVVGDICCVKYGDLLPADGFVIQSSDLKIDESALTGESDLIKKNDTTNSVLLSGTHVMEGSGKFLVTAVGLNSQNGIIFSLLGATKEENKDKDKKKKKDGETELPAESGDEGKKKKDKKDEDNEEGSGSGKHQSVLQAKLTKVTIQISYFGIFCALFTFTVLCLRLAIEDFGIKKKTWTDNYVKYFISYLINGITVLVVTVPEGLPLAVALALAFAVKKMTLDNNLVRHLDACETMGSATTICSDKTGTLTTNRMTAVQCYIGSTLFKTIPKKEDVNDFIKEIASESISINSNYTSKIEPTSQPGELPKQLGNKTECGLLGFVGAMGNSYETIRSKNPVEGFTKVYTFNSARKMMGTVIKNSNGYRLFVKGASEMVLYKCTHILNSEGHLEPLSNAQADGIVKNVVEQMACEGLRTICIAYRDFSPLNESKNINMNTKYYDKTPEWDDEETIMSNLTCICILGIEDPVRPEVPDAIKKCQSSGVIVRMVTGDNVNTATSIALKCGILKPGDNFLVLESKDFNKKIRDSSGNVSKTLFDEVWPRLRVLARSSPQDKYVLVNGIVESKLNVNREVVAVTGDGTNDGPALKRADVGFAMGIQGTDVAKEASDIILTDDNFSSIVKAMMWGRNVHDSIAKFLQFQLTVNLIAALLSIICAATIGTVPLKAVQMLWVNLVMDTLGALALASEPPTEALLKRKPYGRNKPIISPMIFRNLIGQTIYQLAIILSLIWGAGDWMIIEDVVAQNNAQKLKSASQHFTIVFNAFVVMTLFNEINARKINGEQNVFDGIHKNPYYYVIWIICFIVQVIIVQFGGIAFTCEAIDIDHWMWCILFGVGSLIWHQFVMLVPIPWVERFFAILSCKSKSKVENIKNGYGVNGATVSVSSEEDLEKMAQSKVLWVRGIGRIHHQLDVISAFKTRLEEHKMKNLNGSNVSLKESR